MHQPSSGPNQLGLCGGNSALKEGAAAASNLSFRFRSDCAYIHPTEGGTSAADAGENGSNELPSRGSMNIFYVVLSIAAAVILFPVIAVIDRSVGIPLFLAMLAICGGFYALHRRNKAEIEKKFFETDEFFRTKDTIIDYKEGIILLNKEEFPISSLIGYEGVRGEGGFSNSVVTFLFKDMSRPKRSVVFSDRSAFDLYLSRIQIALEKAGVALG